MAKVAKVKNRDVSVRSRAARRGEPGSGQAKAVRKERVEESDYKPWLHNPHDAGVGKKKTKQLTRQQRNRRQKGLEKAEVNLDKLDKKVADSKDRGKKVNARRIGWDELNERLPNGGAGDKKKVESREETKPMEDIVAPDVSQPLETETAAVLESGEDSAKRLSMTSEPQPIAPAPPTDEELDEIT